jgi:hypothetical protein
VNATFKSTTKSGFEGAVQMSTNYALFANLAKLSLHSDASAEAKAIAILKLEQLKSWLTTKVSSDEEWRAHYNYVIRQITLFQQNPEEFKQEDPLPAPPGMPIGDFGIEFCGN